MWTGPDHPFLGDVGPLSQLCVYFGHELLDARHGQEVTRLLLGAGVGVASGNSCLRSIPGRGIFSREVVQPTIEVLWSFLRHDRACCIGCSGLPSNLSFCRGGPLHLRAGTSYTPWRQKSAALRPPEVAGQPEGRATSAASGAFLGDIAASSAAALGYA